MNTRGFTLFELLLVTIIVGIIAGIATPRFSRTFENIKLENFAQNIVETIRYASQKAVLNREASRLVLSQKNKSFWLEKLNKDKQSPVKENTPKQPYSIVTDKIGRPQPIPDGITLGPDTQYINFTPTAEIEKTTVAIINRYNKKCLVVIEENFSEITATTLVENKQ